MLVELLVDVVVVAPGCVVGVGPVVLVLELLVVVVAPGCVVLVVEWLVLVELLVDVVVVAPGCVVGVGRSCSARACQGRSPRRVGVVLVVECSCWSVALVDAQGRRGPGLRRR